MRIKQALLVGFLAALSTASHAQTPETKKPALDLANGMIFDMAGNAKFSEGGSSLQMLAMGGREDLGVGKEDPLPTCVALPGDTIGNIIARSRATNIVIINEHHASPLDRHFIGKVLTALKPEGFTFYAAETFTPYDNLDVPDVLTQHGIYSNEPMFARTMRLAKSLGYKLVAYEETQEQEAASAAATPPQSRINRRDAAQAENLMAKIFRDNPAAKVVLHVGHAHVWERTPPDSKSENVWVAQRLKALTGRDPLTISQADCVSNTSGDVAAEAFVKSDGAVSPPRGVDLLVGHPRLQFRDGRPAWRQDAGDRSTPVPPLFLGLQERVIVEARPDGADMVSVPVDRILLYPGEKLPLLLPPGRYRIDGFLQTGRIDVPPVFVEAP